MLAGGTEAYRHSRRSSARGIAGPSRCARSRPTATGSGSAAITAGLAFFLLLRLHALPPHEDETLAFFVSDSSLGDMLRTVLGERGGAPLHYLLAYLAGLIDAGLTSLRLVSVVFAVGEHARDGRAGGPPDRPADGARRDAARRRQLDDPLPRHLRPDVQPVPLHLDALAPAPPACARAQDLGALGGMGSGDARAARHAAVRRARAPGRGRLRGRAASSTAAAASPPPGRARGGARARGAALADVRPARVPLRGRARRVELRARARPSTWSSTSGTCSATSPRAGRPPRSRRRSSRRSAWSSSRASGRSRRVLVGGRGSVPALALLAAGSGPGVSLETRHLIFLLPFATMAIAAGLFRLGAAPGRAGPERSRRSSGSSSRRRSPGGSTGPAGSTPASRRARSEARVDAAEWLAAHGPRRRRPLRLRADLPRRVGARSARAAESSSRAPTRRWRSRRSRTRASRSAGGSGCSTPPTTSTRARRR